eukprot:7004533-Prymnesium_polylepis.1
MKVPGTGVHRDPAAGTCEREQGGINTPRARSEVAPSHAHAGMYVELVYGESKDPAKMPYSISALTRRGLSVTRVGAKCQQRIASHAMKSCVVAQLPGLTTGK